MLSTKQILSFKVTIFGNFNYPVFPLQCRIWLDMYQANFWLDISYGWLSFTAFLKGTIIIFSLKRVKTFKQKCWGANSADRTQNNGRSTDNARTDWGVDRSTLCLSGQVDWSHSILLKIKKNKISMLFSNLLSVCSELLCIAELRSEILGVMQLEPFTIRTLKQTLGFTYTWVKMPDYYAFSRSIQTFLPCNGE